MSIRLMSVVWELDLTPVEKLVFLALADCANDEGLAWPSIATIQRKANVGERTVQRSIRSLEELGLLTRHEVTGKGCKYIIHPRHSGTPARKSPPPQSAQTPATVAPKPSRTVTNKKRACGIPENWKPLDFAPSSQCYAIVAGWINADMQSHVEHFTAHHTAKASKFADWQSAWQTWVLNSRKWGTPRQAVQTDGMSLAHKVLARKANGP